MISTSFSNRRMMAFALAGQSMDVRLLHRALPSRVRKKKRARLFYQSENMDHGAGKFNLPKSPPV
jgi:hypothetical protein